jgi:hypothetical protein
MINAREQIKDELLKITDNVRLMKPEALNEFPLIVYGEVTNTPLFKWTTRIEYQVDVYTNNFSTLLDLCKEVDKKMTGLGFNMTFISPDQMAREDKGVYHKTIGYEAMVNTKTNNIFSRF